MLDDLHVADRILRSLQRIDETLAHARHGFGIHAQAHFVGGFGGGLVDRDTVDRIHQRPQQGVAGDDQHGQQHAFGQHVRAGAAAHRRRAPQGGGGVQAAHVHAFLHDHAGT
ncbi:hypothetical protein [Stenotrophomonas maltophilia]|uniref:hypothetical protein n=1 Tax=Stenotrophomonas maltophilia TaxID=40324 RepID=UPI001FA6AF32|nr:hypothetical protein [Stenotrophomonas maltophilia]